MFCKKNHVLPKLGDKTSDRHVRLLNNHGNTTGHVTWNNEVRLMHCIHWYVLLIMTVPNFKAVSHADTVTQGNLIACGAERSFEGR